MKSVFVILTLISISSFAGPTIFKVKGMHCSGCAAMVKKSVCDNEEIKKAFGGCTAKTIDEKNEIGEITFASAGDIKIDQQKIQSLLTATDENYKIIEDAPIAKTEAAAKPAHSKSKKK